MANKQTIIVIKKEDSTRLNNIIIKTLVDNSITVSQTTAVRNSINYTVSISVSGDDVDVTKAITYFNSELKKAGIEYYDDPSRVPPES
jgi:hypothetical protein